MANETEVTAKTAKEGEETVITETETAKVPTGQEADEATAGEASDTHKGEKPDGEKPAIATDTKKSTETKDVKEHNREGFQTRKRIRELELENARLKGFQEGVQKAGGKVEPEAASDFAAQYAKQNPKPQAAQFETNEEFVEALTDWKLGLRDAKAEHNAKRTQETESQSAFDKRMFEQRTAGEKKYEDFEEVMSEAIFQPATLAALVESPIGEDIAYHLATNPKEKARIEALNPFLQAKEIGKIEARLEKAAPKAETTEATETTTKEPKKEPKRISTAPEPAPKPKGQAPANVDSEYLSDSTPTARRIELSRARRAQEAT